MPHSLGEVDVVFPLLHGPFGEDGTIQGLLELADIRYVGSGVLASAAGHGQAPHEGGLPGAGIPVGPYAVILDSMAQRDKPAAMDAVASLGFPLFVKPARAGSSMGITKVSAPDDLEAAIEAARAARPEGRGGGGDRGREIECAVLQGREHQPPRTSEVGEIEVDRDGGHDFYDFEAKYLEEQGVTLRCPAKVPDHVSAEVRRPRCGGVRGPRVRGAGPGRLLLHRQRRRHRQRDQHHAGLHPALDVPADVGRHGGLLPRAHRRGSSVALAHARPACADAVVGGTSHPCGRWPVGALAASPKAGSSRGSGA